MSLFRPRSTHCPCRWEPTIFLGCQRPLIFLPLELRRQSMILELRSVCCRKAGRRPTGAHLYLWQELFEQGPICWQAATQQADDILRDVPEEHARRVPGSVHDPRHRIDRHEVDYPLEDDDTGDATSDNTLRTTSVKHLPGFVYLGRYEIWSELTSILA